MSKYHSFLDKYDNPPIGSIVMRMADASVVGEPLLPCNGAAVSRTSYALLYSALGSTPVYGPGDGSTTFNLPDYRGRFLRAEDGGAGVDPDATTRTDRGDGNIGNVIGTKQSMQIPTHVHNINGTAQYQSGGESVSARSNTLTSTENNITGELIPLNMSVKFYIKFK